MRKLVLFLLLFGGGLGALFFVISREEPEEEDDEPGDRREQRSRETRGQGLGCRQVAGSPHEERPSDPDDRSESVQISSGR